MSVLGAFLVSRKCIFGGPVCLFGYIVGAPVQLYQVELDFGILLVHFWGLWAAFGSPFGPLSIVFA